jgi:hypothetical protein
MVSFIQNVGFKKLLRKGRSRQPPVLSGCCRANNPKMSPISSSSRAVFVSRERDPSPTSKLFFALFLPFSEFSEHFVTDFSRSAAETFWAPDIFSEHDRAESRSAAFSAVFGAERVVGSAVSGAERVVRSAVLARSARGGVAGRGGAGRGAGRVARGIFGRGQRAGDKMEGGNVQKHQETHQKLLAAGSRPTRPFFARLRAKKKGSGRREVPGAQLVCGPLLGPAAKN